MANKHESESGAPVAGAAPFLALTIEEQIEIQNLDPIQRELFADHLLDNHSSGPDYYEGWCRSDFCAALFAGPSAFRAALEFVRGKRKTPNALHQPPPGKEREPR